MAKTAVERVAAKLAGPGRGKGFASLARVSGVYSSTVSHWNHPIGAVNGRGGSIPDRCHAVIIAYCKERGIKLRKAELVNADSGAGNVQSPPVVPRSVTDQHSRRR